MQRTNFQYYEISFFIIISLISFIFFYPDGIVLENFYRPGDETTYKNLAIKLVDQNIYAENFDNLRSWRPPGYAFYLAIFYFFFGDYGFKIIPYLNFFLYIVSFSLIFKIANIFVDKKVTFITSFITYIFHFYKFNEVLIINYSETLYFFLICSFLYIFLLSFKKSNHLIFIISFIILSLSYMVRGPTLPLGIVILISSYFFQKTFSKKILFFSLLIFLIPCISWMIRNYFILGFGPHLYTANYILVYYGLFDFLEAHKIDEMVRGLDDLGKVNALKVLIIEKIQNDFLGSIFHFFKKVVKHIYYHNTVISSFILLTLGILSYLKKKKLLLEFLKNKNSKLLVMAILISIIFIMINSMAQFSWRYSLIPSVFKLLFESLLIIHFVKFKSYVFFQNFKS